MSVEGAKTSFTTGDLARRTGATPRAIRFYEQSGLMTSHPRQRGGRRRYTLADVERLQLITDLRDLDLSLDDIKQLLHIRDSCHSSTELGQRLGGVLSEQLEATQRRLQSLRRLREELAATLAVVKECVSCTRELAQHPCKNCDNVTRPESPRMIKVLLGQCSLKQVRAAPEPLVKLKASRPSNNDSSDDGAFEP
jgi:DNA-binding transcriptional MerR regulator